MPNLSKIDHVHIYPSNLVAAERWYADVLGFDRVAHLEFWFEQGGP